MMSENGTPESRKRSDTPSPAKEKVAAEDLGRCCHCGMVGEVNNEWTSPHKGLCVDCEKILPEVPEDADTTPALPAEVHPIATPLELAAIDLLNNADVQREIGGGGRRLLIADPRTWERFEDAVKKLGVHSIPPPSTPNGSGSSETGGKP